MAKKGTAPVRKKVERPVDEVAIEKQLEAFNKKHEGKTLSKEQKEEKRGMQQKLGALKFVRIFNKRFPKLLNSLDGLAALGAPQYSKTETQVKAIMTKLREKVAEVETKLSGAKVSSNGFQLPVDPVEEKTK